jgi:hypothetical protein
MSKPQEIFSLIKQHATGSFKDSLINIMYLKKGGHAVGELAECVIAANINRINVDGLSAKHIGSKTKNRYDSKTDIIIKFGKAFIPFSVKTSMESRIKIKSGISPKTKKLFRQQNVEKHILMTAVKIELSSNLYILHINKREENFVFDLRKIDLSEFKKVKRTRTCIKLQGKDNKTIVSYDVPRSLWYVNKRYLVVIDSFVLGKDNSEDKASRGEPLLINNIIANVCFCDIPALRKIDKIVKEEI